ncbi:Ferritin, Dps family protein [Acidothermus cellulolyticus 11B]|uniref:Ferritin, Dps family protein n=1 Tax=Acidothermus cellulolyticus (strain ATCC 43068 / DSM 8971 / 11B) TaxID=351607 RepID=A0LWG9_ACIC1|nr:DNA starvation/stationary phase protection protein [Acidothermus cellulolyticus]ABK53779.1 Ferritin, Dps family protein [Acidothermus cellulolyticus 11B]
MPAHARVSEPAARFVGSQRLAEHLQAVLADLIELHMQGKQAHWNVVGPNFRDLHLQLDEIVNLAREAGDTVAERMRALHATPDGRTATVAGSTSLPAFPPGEQSTKRVVDLMTERLVRAAATVRRVLPDVEAEDPPTANMLQEIITDLEKHAWMLSAENVGV